MIMFTNKCKPEPIRYWIVTLTLTSGEDIDFYVKAKTQQDALELAKDCDFMVSNEKLLNKFRNNFLLKW